MILSQSATIFFVLFLIFFLLEYRAGSTRNRWKARVTSSRRSVSFNIERRDSGEIRYSISTYVTLYYVGPYLYSVSEVPVFKILSQVHGSRRTRNDFIAVPNFAWKLNAVGTITRVVNYETIEMN